MFNASTTTHTFDRRHTDMLSSLATSSTSDLATAPLSQHNLASNVPHGLGNVYEPHIPSWIFHTGLSAVPFHSETEVPLLPTTSFAPLETRSGTQDKPCHIEPLQPFAFANGPTLQLDSARQTSSETLLGSQHATKTYAREASLEKPMSAGPAASSSSHTSTGPVPSPKDFESAALSKDAPLLPSSAKIWANDVAETFVKPPPIHSHRSGSDDLTFKTSIDRRERNKASQRESRKRKQTRLETLEDENAALRKALRQAGENSVTNSDDDSEPRVTIAGAIHLDGVENHLEDDAVEAEWKGIAGSFFQGRLPSERQSSSMSPTHSVLEVRDAAGVVGPLKKPAQSSAKRTSWQLSLPQMRQASSHRFPAMVVVPELMLYKVCRLYFSIVLPFTSGLKSGLVNLRMARAASGYMGGFDDLPRFRGRSDPSADLILPSNLMPTEAQLRIGFHPVEIAVVPSPAMRNKLLTVLSAFQSIDNLAGSSETSSDEDEPVPMHVSKRMALIADTTRWDSSGPDADRNLVRPDKSRIYSYGFTDKPKGSHRLKLPAQQWLNTFFVDLVQNLRVWSLSGDIFDPDCFEYQEPFIRKYPYMVDEQVLRSTNRWRRARGEVPLRM